MAQGERLGEGRIYELLEPSLFVVFFASVGWFLTSKEKVCFPASFSTCYQIWKRLVEALKNDLSDISALFCATPDVTNSTLNKSKMFYPPATLCLAAICDSTTLSYQK